MHLRQRDPHMPDIPTISKYWAQRWESGRRKPGDRYRPHLCALLGLPHELFDDGYTHAPDVPWMPPGAASNVTGKPSDIGKELIIMAAHESARYGQRHATSNVHPESLEQLADDVRSLSVDFVSEPPVRVVLRARELRNDIFNILDGRQWPQHTRDLYAFAGQICGLLSVASSDFFGRYDAAGTQCRTAWLCADKADWNDLRSWIRSLQSGISFWASRWFEAATLAEQAAECASSAPTATRAAVMSARALAKLGDKDGAEGAVMKSETARQLPPNADAIGVIGFPEANRLRCAGTAYLWLGDHRNAQKRLNEALEVYEREDPGAYAHLAVLRVDLASARVFAGDIAGAAHAIQAVLAAPPERRLAGAARRTHDLRAMLAKPDYRGSQEAQALASEIERFRVDVSAAASDGD
jgi:tetratricopeptide (TPR) repeat protein